MKKILSLFVLLPVMVVGQTQTENYIKTKTYKVATATSIATPTITQANQNITYFDGLGRPIQQVAHQQSGSGKDLVTPIVYDAFGRQEKDYLPYATATASLDYKTTALTDVGTFYSTAAYENTTNPYSQKLFEASPLNRVLKQAAPGNDWALGSGHEIKLDYQTNTASEVKLFSATATWNLASGLYDISLGNATATVFYAANQLYKTITYDENSSPNPSEGGGSTVEFKDKEGKVVLKRTYEASVKHDTYYVYDQYGNLTYVIPPKADAAITTAILNDLCYQYKYDYRNRLVEKKLPGKQWEYIVYDKLDRVVATGPAFSPFSDSPLGTVGWMITKYDVFNRPVYTGWEQSTTVSGAGRFSKQNAMNALTSINESKTTTGTIDGISVFYSNLVAPTSFKLLTVNYNDDYNYPNCAVKPTIIEGENVLSNTKSLSTGSWTRVLTTTGSTIGETATTFYDSKGRPIRNYLKNYLGGYTYTDTKFDFVGVPQYTKTYHKRLTTDVELKTTEVFTYSPQGRLLTHTHQINTGAIQLLAENKYDELGQLIGKNVGNTVAKPLQKVNYTYNIRGWLKDINDITNLQTGSDPKDLFAFKLNYNNVQNETGYTGTPLYNGNIAETYWSTNSDGGVKRKYGYKYDNLNRLRESIYQKPGNVNPVPNSYNENLTYDKNGNILSLLRNGDIEDVLPENTIDNLLYTYNANQLLKVSDVTNNISGFNDGNTTGDDYTYDANGNMTIDKNKNITAIVYNHLNLPTKITFQRDEFSPTISYLYNANGVKLQKIVNTEDFYPTVTTTDYLGGFQYNMNVSYSLKKGKYIAITTPVALQFFPTAEGYVKNTVVSGVNNYSYVFNYTDHLGNVRLSYQDINKDGLVANSEILEESNYYPFGLKHSGYNSGNLQANYKYKYNGKELQDELGLDWYDYGGRFYDMKAPHFLQIDPLAETSRRFSPYAYALDNPVYYIDPDGMMAIDGDPIKTVVNSNQVTNTFTYDDKGKTVGTDKIQQTVVSTMTVTNSDGEAVQTMNTTTMTTAYVDSKGNTTGQATEYSTNSINTKNEDGTWTRTDAIETSKTLEIKVTSKELQGAVKEVQNFKKEEKISPVQAEGRQNASENKIASTVGGALGTLGRGIAQYIPHPLAKGGGTATAGVGASIATVPQFTNPTNPENIKLIKRIK